MKKYIEYNGQTIKTDIYYNIGGYNRKRGYYLSVQPVEITEHKTADGQPYKIEKFSAYSGYFTLLCEATRKSAKQEKDAINRGLQLLPEILQNNFN
jgi:hypothetical protein